LRLLVVKALTVVVIIGAMVLAQSVRDSVHIFNGRLEHPRAKVVLRYPSGWSGLYSDTMSLSATRGGVHVWLQRLAWGDMEVIRGWLPGRCDATPVDTSNPLPFVACYLGMEFDEQTRVVRTRLAGRRAVMIAGPRLGATWNALGFPEKPGWGAVVVATGPDLLFMNLDASSLEALEAAWEDWLGMIRRVQVTDRNPAEPILNGLPDRYFSGRSEPAGITPP
jgi:hypothetical protein